MKQWIYWGMTGLLMGLGLTAFGLALVPFIVGSGMVLARIKQDGPGLLWWTATTASVTALATLLSVTIRTNNDPTAWAPPTPIGVLLFYGGIGVLGIAWGITHSKRRVG